jgi:TRAP-type C4-dicarboxylate transport system permease small subunit
VLDTWERFNRRLSGWFEWIGLIGLLVMMVVTCIDVVGAKVFGCPLMGSIDIVQLAQTVGIAFAASMALILGRHVQVEFFVRVLPPRVGAVINSVILLLGLGLFMVILWQMSMFGYSLQTSGDLSATIYIPYYPFAYGIALACIPFCLVFLLEFLKSLKRRKG